MILDGQTDGLAGVDGWMDGQTGSMGGRGWVAGWTNEHKVRGVWRDRRTNGRKCRGRDGSMDEQTNGGMEGKVNGRMDSWADRRMSR